MDIQKVILLCKKNDKSAEKALFINFAPRVLTLCRRYASHSMLAPDLMQECFIRLFEKIDKYDPQIGDFEGWLHRLCTNTILTQIKTSKRKVDIIYPGDLPEQGITKSEFEAIPAEMIISAIQQLPSGYSQVFNLFTFENYSHKEIAESLGIAESTSRSQLTKARKMLKSILQQKPNLNYERLLA